MLTAPDTSGIDALWDEDVSGVRRRTDVAIDRLAAELADVVRATRAGRRREAELRRALADAMDAAQIERIDLPCATVLAMPNRTRIDGDEMEIIAASGLRVIVRDER